MSSLPRATFIFALFSAGCRYMYGEPAPLPVDMTPAPAALPLEPCERSPEPIVPPGQTPFPTAEGELALLDVRGDDRLTINGYVAFNWSTDGEKLISASNDGVLIWNAATGVLERRIPIPTRIESPVRVVLSPDEKWIAFVAYMLREDQSRLEAPGLFLMRSDGSGSVQRFEGTGDQFSFSADGRRLGTYAHTWDLASGTHRKIEPPKFEHEADFLPGRERAIVYVPYEKPPKQTVIPELRDVESGKPLHRFPAVNTSIGASISGDGKRLGLIQNGLLTVYSLDTFELLVTIPSIGKAQMVQLSHDGHRAVTEVLMCAVALSSDAKDMSWCPKPELTLWDLDTKEKLIQTPEGSGDGWIFTPDGEYLTGPETRLVDYIVRIRDGKELRFGSRIRSISPGSKRVLYDDKLGFEIAALDGKSPVPTFVRSPKMIARSGDGQWQVISGSDGRLQLEGPSSCIRLPLVVPTFGEPRSRYEYFSPDGDQVVFSRDGSSLFTITGSSSNNVRFRAYDTSSGRERWSIQ
ncbi:MAG TPA: WD40 repeat domain-containing protein, partial [Polyangium sp.]|nr:WD40 repeat domain-containing protein [Polyangium sp.]